MKEEPAMILGGVGPAGGNGFRFLPPVVSQLSRLRGCTFCITYFEVNFETTKATKRRRRRREREREIHL